MTIYDRLLLIIETENTSVAAFERKIGVGRNSLSSALRNKSSIGHTLLAKITIITLNIQLIGLYMPRILVSPNPSHF